MPLDTDFVSIRDAAKRNFDPDVEFVLPTLATIVGAKVPDITVGAQRPIIRKGMTELALIFTGNGTPKYLGEFADNDGGLYSCFDAPLVRADSDRLRRFGIALVG